ncbi:MAG: NADH-quinone oxidoreductase subunit A [Planctomycetes bacterium]|nr:NADH-quinone oxidoreductase subunit A [Planctomycetota bacterium]
MTDLVGHFLVFVAGGILIGLIPLLLGRLLRPQLPNPEKEATYECGEPTIGSSYIQFDLRFYTVALLFIIFDVEVAFFFPWAAVYGGAMQLAHAKLEPTARVALSEKLLNQAPGTLPEEKAISAATATKLGWTALADIFVFFGVLLVGFAYVWKRGDLDWVRAIAQRAKRPTPAVAPPIAEPTPTEPQPIG